MELLTLRKSKPQSSASSGEGGKFENFICEEGGGREADRGGAVGGQCNEFRARISEALVEGGRRGAFVGFPGSNTAHRVFEGSRRGCRSGGIVRNPAYL
jgi:hypothetical protein